MVYSEFIQEAIKGIIFMLDKDKLQQWTALYPDLKIKQRVIALGSSWQAIFLWSDFTIFMCAACRRCFYRKLSSNDKHLLPLLAEIYAL